MGSKTDSQTEGGGAEGGVAQLNRKLGKRFHSPPFPLLLSSLSLPPPRGADDICMWRLVGSIAAAGVGRLGERDRRVHNQWIRIDIA